MGVFDRIGEAFLVPSRFIFLMWGIYFFEVTFRIDLGVFGILPRQLTGLIGILTAPLLHGNIWHLTSNTMPMLVLGTILYLFYDRVANPVFLSCYFITNALVWLFARSSYHIGASGLIYGLASFMVFMGFFRQDIRSIVISIAVILFYGGLIYGILPTGTRVSWESHLIGAVVGLVCAIFASRFRRIRSS